MLVFAPLIGSSAIPRRLRFGLAAVLALGMAESMPILASPPTGWHLALGLAGEALFGIAIGLVLSLVLVAARLGGAVAGQLLGFNLAGTLDPGTDMGANPVGDVYFIFTMFLFLAADGHHAMVLGIRNSFDYVPPLAVGGLGMTGVLDVIAGMILGATSLAVRVAAPLCVAMLIVDLAIGMVGRTIPQMNLMSIGLSLRSIAGLAVIILGLGVAGIVLSSAINDGLSLAEQLWLPAAP